MQPVERFKKLCEAAAESSRAFLERHSHRKHLAAFVATSLANYLGVPDDFAKIVEVEISDIIRSKGNKQPIGPDIDLKFGEDRLWYFGLDLHLEGQNMNHFSGVTLFIGVDVVDEGFIVKLEKLYRFKDSTENSLAPIAEDVYQGLLDDLAKPPSKRRKSIGFVNG